MGTDLLKYMTVVLPSHYHFCSTEIREQFMLPASGMIRISWSSNTPKQT